MATRIDISADKGTEEVLDSAFYALSGGVWIEDEAGGVRIICYPADPDRFCAYVRGSGMALRLLAATEEEEKDYAALVRRGFTPVRVGGLTILPPWRRPSKRGRSIVIEPGMAFGTGRHESTKLMIKMMERLPLEGMSVLDIGSGSGVLALCGRRLGARFVAAFNRDRLAAEAIEKAASSTTPRRSFSSARTSPRSRDTSTSSSPTWISPFFHGRCPRLSGSRGRQDIRRLRG